VPASPTHLIPALVLAGGILAATAVAAAAPGLGTSALAGPLVLVASILLVGELVRRQPGAPRGSRPAAAILGGAALLASALVAGSDPSRMAELLPLLGAGAVVLVLGDGGHRAGCRSRDREHPESTG